MCVTGGPGGKGKDTGHPPTYSTMTDILLSPLFIIWYSIRGQVLLPRLLDFLGLPA